MPKLTITRSAQLGSNAEIEQSYEVDVSGSVHVEESVADGSTDLKITIPTIDISAMKSLFIRSTQDVTIKTNSSSTPDDTLNVKSGSPVDWDDKSVHAKPLSADVSSIFVSNSSGSSATLTIYAAQDTTP